MQALSGHVYRSQNEEGAVVTTESFIATALAMVCSSLILQATKFAMNAEKTKIEVIR